MVESEPSTATLHLPPKFNLRGRRQLWFVEGTRFDDPVNGFLTAVFVFVPLLAAGAYL